MNVSGPIGMRIFAIPRDFVVPLPIPANIRVLGRTSGRHLVNAEYLMYTGILDGDFEAPLSIITPSKFTFHKVINSLTFRSNFCSVELSGCSQIMPR